ncbi:hypothetical protein Drorol1_Dr00001432 [Drosera rotundifolia]
MLSHKLFGSCHRHCNCNIKPQNSAKISGHRQPTPATTMGSTDTVVVEIDNLQRSLLSDPTSNPAGADDDEEEVIYAASFAGTEENFVKYHTAQWVLYSLLLVLAWGIGFFMLLYLPVRRYVLRKEIRSRRLFVTNNSIVYQVVRPVPFPCFGVLEKEKHVLLPSVADIVIEQGYLQSLFEVYSVRIENVGVRRPPSDDVQIQGVADPAAFRKAVLARLAYIRTEAFARQISSSEDISNLRTPHQQGAWSGRQEYMPPTGELIFLQKLEEVGNSVKRVQTLIEERHSQTSESAV